VRAIDVALTSAAPYAALTWDTGPLSIDASVRRDRQRASGWQQFDNAPGANGAFTGWDQAGRTTVNYSTASTSYSFGANYAIDPNMAAFGRASKGSSWASPDRIIWDAAIAGGTQKYPINELKQIEAGLKMRQGAFNGFFTFFNAKTKEDGGFEVTTRQYLKDSYTANGIEAELAWHAGAFAVSGGATWTKAKITTAGALNGNKPRRQADFVYQVTPTYSFGPLEIGAAVIGTTQSYAQNDNQVVLPAYVVVNPFASYALSDKLQLSLSINNLFDKVGYTEAEGQGNLSNNPLYIARSINGRSTKATLKYSF
jgi:outer membrane receptor protein involved in Fe transport